MGFVNSGHKLGSLIVGSHEYLIEREDGDWKCIWGRGHSVTLHRVGTASHFSSCSNLVEFRQLPCEWCFGRRIQPSKQASKRAIHPPTHQPTSSQAIRVDSWIIQQLRTPISNKQWSKRMDLLDRCGFMDCLLLLALILRAISRNFWPSWPLLVYVQIWSPSTWRWLPLRLARGLFGDMSDRWWVFGAQIVAVKDIFGTWCNFEVRFLVNNVLIVVFSSRNRTEHGLAAGFSFNALEWSWFGHLWPSCWKINNIHQQTDEHRFNKFHSSDKLTV